MGSDSDDNGNWVRNLIVTYCILRLNIAAILVALLLLVGAGKAFSAPTVDRTFALVNYPPFSMHENDKVVGVFAEFIAELDTRTGTHSRIILVPVNRARSRLLSGAVDYTIMPAGPLVSGLDAPLAEIGRMGYIVWPRRNLSIKRFADMQGLVYAAFRNGHFMALFESEPLMDFAPINRFETGMRLIKSGRVDAMTGAASAMIYYLDNSAAAEAELGEPFLLDSTALGVFKSPKKSPDTMHEKLVPVLQQMAKENRYNYYQARLFAGSKWRNFLADNQPD